MKNLLVNLVVGIMLAIGVLITMSKLPLEVDIIIVVLCGLLYMLRGCGRKVE